jgi:beta-lactam-binding protein with PASTA domain
MTGAKRLGLLLLLTWVGSFSALAQDPDEKGPVRSLAQVTVPSCVGLLGGKGRAALEAVGLKWQYAPQGIPTGEVARNATVAAQAPAAGQRVARGSTVTLTLYVFVEPQPDEKGRVKLPRR